MKLFLLIYFILLNSFINAQTTKLDYEPKGAIVKFHFDSLTIYTDTTSLFKVYAEEGTMKDYDLRVINFVRNKIAKHQDDTINFSGNFIPFNDSIKNTYQKDWYVDWVVLQLTKKNKLKIYDKQGSSVTKIKRKKIGTRKAGYVRRAFINKETGEELFSELLYMITGTPSF